MNQTTKGRAMSVLDNIEHIADLLEANAAAGEQLGRLTDETATALKSAGVVRMGWSPTPSTSSAPSST